MAVQCGACGASNEGWIPKERLDKVSEQRRGLKEQLANAQQALEDLQTEADSASAQNEAKLIHAETLIAKVAKLEAAQSGWDTERALLAAGVTNEEGIGIARLLWDRLPEDSKPQSVSEWLQGESVPLAIKAYLPEPAAEPAAEQSPEPEAEPAAQARINRNPPTNRGAVGTAPTAPIYTRGSIEGMSLDEYRAHREQIEADRKANR